MANFKMDGKAFFMIFLGTIITIALLSTIGDSVFLQTNTFSVANVIVTAPAVNATLDLTGRTLIGTGTVANTTNASTNTSGVVIQTGTGTGGLQSIQLSVNQTANNFAGKSVNVSYTFQPDGYLSSGVSRSVIILVVLFGALGIFITVVVILLGDASMGKIIRGERLNSG